MLARLDVGLPNRHVSGSGKESPTRLARWGFRFLGAIITDMIEPPQGDPALVAVDRALGEMRRGRAVVVHDVAAPASGWRLLVPIETASATLVDHVLAQGASLLVTGERAAALRVPCESDEVLLLCADAFGVAGVRLAKSAQLLPALLASGVQHGALPTNTLAVSIGEIDRYAQPTEEDVVRVSEARVPLRDAGEAQLVLFRDRRDASEHVAVIVGTPDLAGIVPVRAHSSCFTGDLLGSLRCDCGEQLQIAVQRLHEAGGGVLLYLAQEGRGIGLANKLRAYQLQDAGLDTVDADRHLGFSADERSYAIAAAMLRQLGITRIKLLTNSPHKVRELRARGIDVHAIETLATTPNVHNEKYMRTKRERVGHLLPNPARTKP